MRQRQRVGGGIDMVQTILQWYGISIVECMKCPMDSSALFTLMYYMQFGGQAPGTSDEERQYAYKKFGLDTFPIMVRAFCETVYLIYLYDHSHAFLASR